MPRRLAILLPLLAAVLFSCGPRVVEEAAVVDRIHREPTQWIAEGAGMLAQGRFHDAQIAFVEAIRLEPRSVGGWIGFGLACLRAGNARQADAAVETARPFAEREPAYHLLRAECALWRGAHDEAAAALEEALRNRIHAVYREGALSVSEAHTNLLLAEVRLAQRRPFDAVEPIARARALGLRPFPEGFSPADRTRLKAVSTRLATAIQNSLSFDLEPSERERRLRLLVRSEPEDAHARVALGQAILARPSGPGFARREAIESFDFSARRLVRSAEPLSGLAEAYLRGDDGTPWGRGFAAAAARVAFLRLRSADQGGVRAPLGLADIACRNDQGARFGKGFVAHEAKRWAQAALSVDPGCAEARDTLARLSGDNLPDPAFCAVDEIPAAAARWESMLWLKPGDPAAARALSILAYRTGDPAALAPKIAAWTQADPKASLERDALAEKARGFVRALEALGPDSAGGAHARAVLQNGTVIEGRLLQDSEEVSTLKPAAGLSTTLRKSEMSSFKTLSREEWEAGGRLRLRGMLEASGREPSLESLLRALQFGRERGLRADLVPLYEKAARIGGDVASKCREARAAEALRAAHWLRLTGREAEGKERLATIVREFSGTPAAAEADEELKPPPVAVRPPPEPEPVATPEPKPPEPEPVATPELAKSAPEPGASADPPKKPRVKRPRPKPVPAPEPQPVATPEPKPPEPEPGVPAVPTPEPKPPEPALATPTGSVGVGAAAARAGDLPLEEPPTGDPLVQADFLYEKGLELLRRACPGGGSPEPDREARAAMRYFDRAIPLYQQAKTAHPNRAASLDERLEETGRLRYGCFKIQRVHM